MQAYMKKKSTFALLFTNFRQFLHIIYCSKGCDCLYSYMRELYFQARTEVLVLT